MDHFQKILKVDIKTATDVKADVSGVSFVDLIQNMVVKRNP